jgi:hypothetical protein
MYIYVIIFFNIDIIINKKKTRRKYNTQRRTVEGDSNLGLLTQVEQLRPLSYMFILAEYISSCIYLLAIE